MRATCYLGVLLGILLLLLIIASNLANAQMPSDLIAHAPAPGVLDLQHVDPAIFASSVMADGMTLQKTDSIIGYALINGSRLQYQNVTDYIGLPGSTVAWKDKEPDPIGSVAGG